MSHRRAGLALLATSWTCAPGLAQQATAPPTASPASAVSADSEVFTLGLVQVTTSDVYEGELETSALRRLINATHWTTREAVIHREIWHETGDLVDTKFAEELERNLRATGLFADVTVKLVPSSDPDAAPGVRNLQVRTRDRLSIGGGAGASFVGDATSGSASLSESNLFGMGDRLRFSYTENDFGETRGQVGYRDRYVAGTWTTANAVAGRNEEGNFFGLSFDRPFRFLEDRFAWNVSATTTAFDQDYFFSNSTVAEVPIDFSRFEASARWRSGTRMNYWTRGLAARFTDYEYGAARGPFAPSVRVPGDTEAVFAGGTLSWANLSEFREVTHIDTLQFVQDVRIGTTAFLEAGALLRSEDAGGSALPGDSSAGESTQPSVSARLGRILAIGESRFASAAFSGAVRTRGGDATGWRTDVNLRAFDQTWRPHTLGLAVSYTEADETENLPIQLALGERTGLRGYPNREFVGQRLVRINLEDRIDLDAHLRSLDFGAVVFFDTAWIGSRGDSLEGPFSSAGVGLRIGSTPLLGRGVARIDLSFPFDDANGESFEPLLSLTVGQVFTL